MKPFNKLKHLAKCLYLDSKNVGSLPSKILTNIHSKNIYHSEAFVIKKLEAHPRKNGKA